KGVLPSSLILLQAYGALLGEHPEYASRYFALLQELERTDPGNPLVQGAIGNRDLHAGKYQEAITHLQQALQNEPAKTILYTDLAAALVKLDRTSEALAALRKASELDPFNPTVRKMLILQLIQAKDYSNAKMEMEDYIERFPDDSFMRQMLTRAQSAERQQ